MQKISDYRTKRDRHRRAQRSRRPDGRGKGSLHRSIDGLRRIAAQAYGSKQQTSTAPSPLLKFQSCCQETHYHLAVNSVTREIRVSNFLLPDRIIVICTLVRSFCARITNMKTTPIPGSDGRTIRATFFARDALLQPGFGPTGKQRSCIIRIEASTKRN